MNVLKKLALWLSGVALIILLAFIAIGIYANHIDVCDPYQGTFLGKTIKFPMTISEANHLYHLNTNGLIGWHFSEYDTLMVVDSPGSTKVVDRIVFYLRDLSLDDRGKLYASLEKRYGQKFTFKPVTSALSYMKLSDCVFLQVSNLAFSETDLVRPRAKSPPAGLARRKITCIISFCYHVSEDDISGISSEGGWSYGLPPEHRGAPHYIPGWP